MSGNPTRHHRVHFSGTHNLMKIGQSPLYGELVATPEPGPTRFVGPNRNPRNTHLILFIYILLRFLFQKCRDPNPRLDPKGGSEPDPGLLRRFQLSYQNIFLILFLLRFSIYAEAFSNGRPTNIYISSNAITVKAFYALSK